MNLFGLNAFHGDASAAVVTDGVLTAAAEEERFNRIKHAAGFPAEALRYCMQATGASAQDMSIVAIARDPWARFVQKALHAIKRPGFARDRLRAQGKFATIADEIGRAIGADPRKISVHRVEHHRAHLASAFFVSPFEEAALFSVDGLGDFASAMWGVGRGNRITVQGSVLFPHSLGIFYTALTQYLGFPKYGDEYKVMGLASYGSPEFASAIAAMVSPLDGDGIGFRLGLDYFVHHASRAEMTWAGGEPTVGTLYSDALVKRLGKARQPGDPVEARHQNIAASMQLRLEEVLLEQLRRLQRKTGLRKLCLAGGVAFNCVANGKILEQTGFDDVYVASAAGDAGLAVGAAMYVWHQQMNQPRGFVMQHSYWGPQYAPDAIRAALDARAGEIEREGCAVRHRSSTDELVAWTAHRLADGQVVGWFQGRMEWGPRALGNRSILADPRRADIRDVLNAKIKRREMFRPFAPSILEEATSEYFEQSHPSPFMLMAYRVRPEKRDVIPATTHVDGTGRLQTVNEAQNERYYRLIREFGRQTGVPVLLNTSFNENEPVVCRPEEAIECFLRTKMDALVLGDWTVERPDGQGLP